MPYGKREWGQEKILIVDDVETNRLVLEEIIHSMGCSPVLAESGEEALAMVSVSHPQLVLTDISMPGMDGYALCRALKGKEETREIRFICISAYYDPMYYW